MSDVQDKASVIWSAAGKLRNDYSPYEYQKKIPSRTITRRMNCVSASTNDKVLKAHEEAKRPRARTSSPRSTGHRSTASFGR